MEPAFAKGDRSNIYYNQKFYENDSLHAADKGKHVQKPLLKRKDAHPAPASQLASKIY